MRITQAVILAGGLGLRMRPYSLTTPKPMIKINGKPFLEYLIQDLKNNGITEVLLLVGYKHKKIEKYFLNGGKFGVSISYSYSNNDTDTGSRLKNAYTLLSNTFLLLYGDNIWPFNLKDLIKNYLKSKKILQMTIYNNRNKTSKNNVLITNNIVKIYDPKRSKKNLNGVNIGYFIANKSILKNTPNSNFSFDTILLNLVKERQIATFRTDQPYYSLTSPERLPKMREYLKEKKVVFLDRDGVINQKAAKAEYITSWKDFVFLPKVKNALKTLDKKGYQIYIVTNQSGIARKVVSKKTIDTIHKLLVLEIKKQGVTIKHIYMCPHGWDENCWCRKPNPGMLFQAASENTINLTKSILIGDDERDIQAGKAAGCKTYLVSQKNDLFGIVEKYL